MTDDQVEHLCARLASGGSFRAACRAIALDEGTARWWLGQPARAEVKARVLAAREAGCDALADECVEIADGDGSAADKRVRIDTRLRLMGKWNQRGYGDKVKHIGGDPGDAPIAFGGIEICIVDPDGLTDSDTDTADYP